MAHQENGLCRLVNLHLREVNELLDQMRPVVGDRVFAVMAKFFDRVDLEAPCSQTFEQNAVGAGGETVGVREDHQINFSWGVVIFFKAWLRPDCNISGTSVCSPFHMGSSMLSNTS